MRRVLWSLALCLLVVLSCSSQDKSFTTFLAKLRGTEDSLECADLISKFLETNPEPIIGRYGVGAGRIQRLESIGRSNATHLRNELFLQRRNHTIKRQGRI
jgi:hypothetical protein